MEANEDLEVTISPDYISLFLQMVPTTIRPTRLCCYILKPVFLASFALLWKSNGAAVSRIVNASGSRLGRRLVGSRMETGR